MDQITSDTITKEGKPQTMSGLQDHKLDQPHKQCAASFGVGRSIVEHIFNCRVIIAKHLEHQRNLYHNFIDFKKAFDRVCHHGLWKVLISGTIYGGFVKPSGLSATIPAASYPEQSTNRILSGILSASDRGVYSLLLFKF